MPIGEETSRSVHEVDTALEAEGATFGSGCLGDRLTRRWIAVGTATAVAVFWLIGTAGRPLRLFSVSDAVTSNWFDIQARSLLGGHLSVRPGTFLIEEFVTPSGSHMYFGILPALIRMPLILVATEVQGRLTLASCLCAVVVMSVCSARIARRAQSVFFAQSNRSRPASPRWFALFAAAPVLFSPVLFLSSQQLIYHEAAAWGVATALWGIDATFQWWYRHRAIDGLMLALAAAAALNSRPTVGAGPVLAIALLTIVLLYRRNWRRAGWGVLAAFVSLSTYMTVNYARFGQLWGAPGDLQVANRFIPELAAASQMTHGSLLSLRFVPTTAWTYFVPFTGTVAPTRLAPFIRFADPPAKIGSAPMLLGESGSLPTSAPVLLLLAVVGTLVLVRKRDLVWSVVVIAAAVPTGITLAFWTVWHRYLTDFVPVLVVLSAVGFWALRERLIRAREGRRRAVTGGLVLLLVVGFWAEGGLALWGRYFYLFPNFDDLVSATELRYRIDRLIFDGPPPDVVYVGVDTPRDALPEAEAGKVLVVGECDAIYAANIGFGNWRSFERRSGGDRRTIVSPSGVARLGASLLAQGDGWTLRTTSTPDSGVLAVTYASDVGVTATGRMDIGGDPALVDIVADPFTNQVQVYTDGQMVIDIISPAAEGLRIGPEWLQHPASAPRCDAIVNGY